MPKLKPNKKSLRDAHDKHNLRKYPHFAQCTKIIEVKPKMECEVIKGS